MQNNQGETSSSRIARDSRKHAEFGPEENGGITFDPCFSLASVERRPTLALLIQFGI